MMTLNIFFSSSYVIFYYRNLVEHIKSIISDAELCNFNKVLMITFLILMFLFLYISTKYVSDLTPKINIIFNDKILITALKAL